jgi:hypothetical protein
MEDKTASDCLIDVFIRYWEVIESYRRIIFTAGKYALTNYRQFILPYDCVSSLIVLSVILRGTNSQAALAVILSMISIKIYQAYQVTAFICVLNYLTFVSPFHIIIAL